MEITQKLLDLRLLVPSANSYASGKAQFKNPCHAEIIRLLYWIPEADYADCASIIALLKCKK